MAEKTNDFPKLRVSSEVQNRMSELLKRAKNGMSKIQLADLLLTETLDQIESAQPEIGLAPTVALLRRQLGLHSLQDIDAIAIDEMQLLRTELKSLSERISAIESSKSKR